MTDLDDYRKKLWPLPLQTTREGGLPRRVGVEIEFTGLQIEQIVGLIASQLGGRPVVISDYEVLLEGSQLGDFGIELDFAYIKNLSRERHQRGSASDFDELTESIVGAVAKQWVPFEVVGPPVDMADLWQIESVFADLRQAGAQGTSSGTTHAFGLQLNPEMPDCRASTICNYLVAFFCLFDWLKARSKVDLTRRLTSYIDPFSKDYVQRVIDPQYRPNLKQLIDDYLHYNPTRNRALDMLPLFTHLDPERVRAKVDDDRVKPRPTLHYRLPNSLIDNPDWGLIIPWRDWLQVDNLANRPKALAEITAAYRKHLSSITDSLFSDWSEQVSPWLLAELL
jgi:hypothetical protein